MTKEQARIILESLLGRLQQSGKRFTLPDGVLSQQEVSAICTAADIVDDLPSTGTAVATQAPTAGEAAPSVVRAAKFKLDLTSLERAEPSSGDPMLCLDFGTAMSKAWGWSGDMQRAFPLLLGKRAGESDDAALISSLFIRRDGALLFGGAAERHHNERDVAKEGRLDNLKRRLSEGFEEVDPDRVPLGADYNPTDVRLSYGDAIQLYLAFLTDIAVSDLVDASTATGSGDRVRNLRYVTRRFAMPCFSGRREQAARLWLGPAFLRAQILADTLRGQWSSNLKVQDLVGLLDEVRNLDRLPDYLLANDAAVKEPIAAVATRIEDYLDGREARRLLIMVVDAGAGTTDFAMFQVKAVGNSETSRIYTIAPTVDFIPIAGNRVDDALRECLIKTHPNVLGPGVMSRDDWSLANAELSNRLRRMKEGLLRTGLLELTLGTGHAIRLERDEFLESEQVQKLQQELRKKQEDVLASLGEGYFKDMEGREQGVVVLLTGGTSQLPLFTSLATRQVIVNGVTFKLRKGPDLPAWIDVTEYGAIRPIYPQLAVAIGGAAADLPLESGSLEAAISPPPRGERVLERYPTRGV